MRDYFGRFTPAQPDLCSLDLLSNFIKKYTLKYVVSYEVASRPHYHFCVFNMEISSELLRDHFKRKFIDGQVYLSQKDIQNKISCIAYTFKDGCYTCSGITVDEFLLSHAIAKPKLKYDDIVLKLEEDYLKDRIDEKKLVEGIMDGHIKTNKKVYVQHIKSHLALIKLKKVTNSKYKEILINKILDD